MGREIQADHFRKQDFQRFQKRLRRETELLAEWMAEGRFSDRHETGGFELEAWLVDSACQPAPVNTAYLATLADPLLSHELSRFNFEINTRPRSLCGDALSAFLNELTETWGRCWTQAAELGIRPVMIGILPTVRELMLTLPFMSPLGRYRALNEQIIRMRRGRPQLLDIQGVEHLRARNRDVMFEAATTSFQVHLQVPPARSVRYFNASQIASAPTVAIGANSPFLFGRRLWRETRVPLFEQAVSVGGFQAAVFGPVRRVTFGNRFLRHSLLELFRENLEHYPILLPALMDEPAECLPHLRLQNGTIWRWNRPLIGFDEDGTPHLRIEHRVMAAGPTPIDSIANAAFYFGLVAALTESEPAPETEIDFVQARENFYSAAKHSLDARIVWRGRKTSLRRLLIEQFLPMAARGLDLLGCRSEDIHRFLGVIEARVQTGQTGAAWQIGYVGAHGPDFPRLVAAYLNRQESGEPVHEWDF